MADPEVEKAYDQLWDMGPPVRRILRTVLRIAAAVSALLLVYFFLPIKQEDVRFASFVVMILGLILFAWIFARELGKVFHDEHPELRSIEALAVVATLFVLVFATAYTLMSASFDGSFGEPLTKVDALYFSMTVLSTVGFGDIHPVTQAARVLVTIQMTLDLVLIGLAFRLFASTAKAARRRLVRPGDGSDDGSGVDPVDAVEATLDGVHPRDLEPGPGGAAS